MELSREELIVLIKEKFVPFDDIEEFKEYLTFDRDGPIWDISKLKKLSIDDLEMLYKIIRDKKFLGFY